MTCPSELTLSMHLDGALTGDDAVATEQHAQGCAMCSARLAAMRLEAEIVTTALTHVHESYAVPAYRQPLTRGTLVTASVAVLAIVALAESARSLLGQWLPSELDWFNPFDTGTFVDLTIRAAIFVAQEGGVIMISIAQAASVAAVIGLLIWVARLVREKYMGPLMLASLLCLVVVQPMPAHALDIRHSEDGVSVAAEETVDDTLIVFGDTIEIDGNVTGDLIAFGRRVAIRGNVGGLVITAAQTVTIDGEVAGSVVGFAAEALGISSTRIGRNLYGFSTKVESRTGSRVEQNAMVFAERADIAGAVGRDLFGFTEELASSGAIDGALVAYANRITLLAPARIGGDFKAHVPEKDNVTVSPSAVVGGETTIDIAERPRHENEYLTGGYYLAQLLRLVAAFLVGALLLALVPSLRAVSINGASGALVASGIGLVGLIAAPIIAVFIAITIVGIPIGIFTLLIWMVGIYLAKIVVAQFVGTRLLESADNPRHFTISLGLGLLTVIVLINVPFIGGVLNFLLTILGFGLLVLFVWRAVRNTEVQGA
jgi:cytoskeletal protein CcmA (bactofilin family)